MFFDKIKKGEKWKKMEKVSLLYKLRRYYTFNLGKWRYHNVNYIGIKDIFKLGFFLSFILSTNSLNEIQRYTENFFRDYP